MNVSKRSVEDYLENILILGEHVHAVNIAEKMGVSKAAVTKALKNLVEKDFVYIVNHHINLTEAGRAYAQRVAQKHALIKQHFMNLGVSESVAEKDACLAEHLLSEETLIAIKKQLDKDSERKQC